MAKTYSLVSRRWMIKTLPAVFAAARRRLGAETSDQSAFQVRAVPLFCREDGKLKRVLAASFKSPVDPAGRIEISAAGRTTRIELRNARRSGSRVLLPVEAPEQDAVLSCVYRAGNKSLETRVKVEPERHWTLYLVHQCHHDLGYDDLPSKVRPAFLKELDDAVVYARQTSNLPEEARFKWNIEISSVLQDYRRLRDPKAFAEVVELLKYGSLELGALYTNLQTELLTVEPLHRAVHYATAAAKELGIQVQAAALDDVPGFTWAMADVFHRSGIR